MVNVINFITFEHTSNPSRPHIKINKQNFSSFFKKIYPIIKLMLIIYLFIFFVLEFGEAPKDIDFRVGLMPNIAANQTSAAILESKKRLSEELESAESKAKKAKSEKIDM